MKQFMIALCVLIFGAGILFAAAAIGRSNMMQSKSSADAEYLQWALQYFVDTRVNLCYAKTTVNTLTNVPCSPEVLKIARPIK